MVAAVVVVEVKVGLLERLHTPLRQAWGLRNRVPCRCRHQHCCASATPPNPGRCADKGAAAAAAAALAAGVFGADCGAACRGVVGHATAACAAAAPSSYLARLRNGCVDLPAYGPGTEAAAGGSLAVTMSECCCRQHHHQHCRHRLSHCCHPRTCALQHAAWR